MKCVYHLIFSRICGFLFSSKWPTLQLSLAHRRLFALVLALVSLWLSHLYICSDLSVITWFCLSIRYSRIYRENGDKLLGQQLNSGIA